MVYLIGSWCAERSPRGVIFNISMLFKGYFFVNHIARPEIRSCGLAAVDPVPESPFFHRRLRGKFTSVIAPPSYEPEPRISRFPECRQGRSLRRIHSRFGPPSFGLILSPGCCKYTGSLSVYSRQLPSRMSFDLLRVIHKTSG